MTKEGPFSAQEGSFVTKEDAFMTEAGALKAKNGPKPANSTAFDQNQRFSAISECSVGPSEQSFGPFPGGHGWRNWAGKPAAAGAGSKALARWSVPRTFQPWPLSAG
jgi:hypothetical protein